MGAARNMGRPEASLSAKPNVLPADVAECRKGLAAIAVLSACGENCGRDRGADKKRSCRGSVSMRSGMSSATASLSSRAQTGQGIVAVAATIGSRPMGVVPIEDGETQPQSKYDRLFSAAKQVPAAVTMVVHPCDKSSLRGVCEAAAARIISRSLWDHLPK